VFATWRSGEPVTALGVAGFFWAVFAFYWLIMSFGRTRARRRENPLGRLFHVLYMGTAFYLLYPRNSQVGVLRERFAPLTPWIAVLGVALTGFGVAFAIWARHHIGKQWSSQVEIREDHKLIATGPYATIRHPIYTGMLTAMLGTALIIGEWRGLAAVVIATFGFWIKARQEERFLEQEFGAAYAEHRRRTGFFLPPLFRRASPSSGVQSSSSV